MTKFKKYKVGKNRSQFEIKLVIYQNDNLYKFVLTDDKDDIYIATNFVTSAIADEIEKTIDVILNSAISAQLKYLSGFYGILIKTFYEQFFYTGIKTSPKLIDGVLLLTLSD